MCVCGSGERNIARKKEKKERTFFNLIERILLFWREMWKLCRNTWDVFAFRGRSYPRELSVDTLFNQKITEKRFPLPKTTTTTCWLTHSYWFKESDILSCHIYKEYSRTDWHRQSRNTMWSAKYPMDICFSRNNCNANRKHQESERDKMHQQDMASHTPHTFFGDAAFLFHDGTQGCISEVPLHTLTMLAGIGRWPISGAFTTYSGILSLKSTKQVSSP